MLEVPKRVDVLMINFESTGGSYVNLDSDARLDRRVDSGRGL
jgi:hypothetical protein